MMIFIWMLFLKSITYSNGVYRRNLYNSSISTDNNNNNTNKSSILNSRTNERTNSVCSRLCAVVGKKYPQHKEYRFVYVYMYIYIFSVVTHSFRLCWSAIFHLFLFSFCDCFFVLFGLLHCYFPFESTSRVISCIEKALKALGASTHTHPDIRTHKSTLNCC